MPKHLTRRVVLAGACGTCAAVATGCAVYTPSGPAVAPAAPTAPAPDAGAPAGGGAVAPETLAAVADVPVGGGVVLADRDLVIVQPVAGEFRAYSATCTHQGCAVSEVTDGQIVCTCHGSMFAVADGSPTAGPAQTALPGRAVAVDGTSLVSA